LLGLLTAALLLGASLFALRRPQPPPIVLHPPPTAVPTAAPTATATPGPVTVFVSGAVARPGLYTLAPDARVGDALAGAGGLLPAADAAWVNQADHLVDGAHVHIPTVDEVAAIGDDTRTGGVLAGLLPTATPLAAAASRDQSPSQPINQSPAAPGGLININTASAAELETLPGIGPSKAAAIIENRPFVRVDDLERVPGIGAKTVDQLRSLVTAE
jgi:competence protein ComEA